MTTEHMFTMDELAELLQGLVGIDKDSQIVIDGEAGGSKTTLAIKIARKSDPTFWNDFENRIFFSRKDLINGINTLPPKSAAIMDEAIFAVFKRDFASSGQKELVKILNVCRSRNLIIIWCLPNFWDFDSSILYRIRMRIRTLRRGLGAIFIPSKNPFTDDPWSRRQNLKNTMYVWDRYPDLKRCIGWIGLIEYGDMTKEEKERYNPIKDKKTKERYEAELKRVADKERGGIAVMKRLNPYYKLIKELSKNGMKGSEIARITGLTPAHISDVINEKVGIKEIKEIEV